MLNLPLAYLGLSLLSLTTDEPNFPRNVQLTTLVLSLSLTLPLAAAPRQWRHLPFTRCEHCRYVECRARRCVWFMSSRDHSRFPPAASSRGNRHYHSVVSHSNPPSTNRYCHSHSCNLYITVGLVEVVDQDFSLIKKSSVVSLVSSSERHELARVGAYLPYELISKSLQSERHEISLIFWKSSYFKSSRRNCAYNLFRSFFSFT